MTFTVLITRPSGDGEMLTNALHAIGAQVIHEPMTDIVLRHHERHALQLALLSEPDAVIVTSRHGIEALALLTPLRDLFLLCVGEATAARAHDLGFTQVSSGGGSAQRLTDYILAGYDAGSRFVYASGEHVRAPIDTILARHGMEMTRVAIYEAVAAETLSDTLCEQLRRGQIDAATFLSQRAAAIFTRLMGHAGLTHTCARLRAFCLSAAIAEPLAGDPWQAIHIASEPTLASLAESVDNAFHSG